MLLDKKRIVIPSKNIVCPYTSGNESTTPISKRNVINAVHRSVGSAEKNKNWE